MQLLRKLAFPISVVYALIVIVRNFLYDTGVFKSRSFKTKTICVGNLSVGGTGKTPMIEYLIKLITAKHKVAVLSRGYKRKSKGFVLATKKTVVEEIGDEPFQIHSKYPNVHVAVDADRCNGIDELEKDIKPEIILMDDAFQHRKVKPSFSIILTTYDKPYTADWYLPTGDLRDSKKEARRADIIVVTKCPDDLNVEAQNAFIESLNTKDGQEVLFSSIAYNHSLKGVSAISLSEIANQKFTLVTGIANSKPLVTYVKKRVLNFEHLEFKDHHFFTEAEIASFNSKDIILTTEKDYVRLNGRVDKLYYITIETQFLNDGDKILVEQLNQLMN